MSSSPRFMYLNVNGERVGCLAVAVDRERNVVKYRTAVVHKNDAFSKEKARLISSGRLAADPLEVSVSHEASAHEITTAVMQHLLHLEDTPSKARKAASEWLDTNPKHG